MRVCERENTRHQNEERNITKDIFKKKLLDNRMFTFTLINLEKKMK